MATSKVHYGVGLLIMINKTLKDVKEIDSKLQQEYGHRATAQEEKGKGEGNPPRIFFIRIQASFCM